jgi:sulfite exporter TauE/SafE/copper chaperone CopZ
MEQKIYVSGMTCSACEKHVSKALLSVGGVQKVQVKRSQGTAFVTTKNPLSKKAVKTVLVEAGYDLSNGPIRFLTKSKSVKKDFFISILIVIVIFVIFNLLGIFSLTDMLNTSGQNNLFDPKSLGLVLILGVVASLSTCMALVGGLVLGFSADYAEHHPEASSKQLMIPQVIFNLGRIIGFGLLGAIVGEIGSLVSLSGVGLTILVAIVAVVMLMLGIRLTEISPRISGWTFALPASITSHLPKFAKTSGPGAGTGGGGYSHITPFLLGIVSFFLPCGFTQAVQLFALSTGNPLWAGILMSGFAIGTTPGLLGLSSLTVIKQKGSKFIFRFLGVLIIGFSLFNLSNALAPYIALPDIGAVFSGSSVATNTITDNVKFDGTTQTIETDVGSTGYTPYTTVAYANVPIVWHLNFKGFGCASSMNLNDLGLESQMVTEDKTLSFTLDQVKTYSYRCSMGMYQGKIVTIDQPQAIGQLQVVIPAQAGISGGNTNGDGVVITGKGIRSEK